jgi:hypothetical protein
MKKGYYRILQAPLTVGTNFNIQPKRRVIQ